MARRLIRNGYIVSMNRAREVFDDGFVATDGQKISAVGPMSVAPAPSDFDEVIDASGTVVIPGLINLHQHHWYTLFKGLADGYLLEDWVFQFLLPSARHLSPQSMRAAAYVSAMEMLATGTTCFLNHSVTTTTPDLVAASIEPMMELGIRQIYAKELRCRTRGNPEHPMNLDEALSAYAEEVGRWNGKGSGRVRMAMVIESAAHWTAAGMTSEELITRGHELACKLNLRIANHVAGGTYSIEKGFLKYLRETGRTDVRYLMQVGVLDPHWVLIHGIHVTDLDIEHMAHVGCSFVYTPTSESIRGGGIAPFAVAQRAGVNVALGTDGPMVDYSVDMIEQMKACTLMQNVRHLDPTSMPAERALEMATINAATALGLETELGSLEPEKQADIVLVDLRKPHVGIVHRPISSLLYAAKGTDVSTVLVAGDVVYREGQFANWRRPAEAVAEAHAYARDILKKSGLDSRLTPSWRI